MSATRRLSWDLPFTVPSFLRLGKIMLRAQQGNTKPRPSDMERRGTNGGPFNFQAARGILIADVQTAADAYQVRLHSLENLN